MICHLGVACLKAFEGCSEVAYRNELVALLSDSVSLPRLSHLPCTPHLGYSTLRGKLVRPWYGEGRHARDVAIASRSVEELAWSKVSADFCWGGTGSRIPNEYRANTNNSVEVVGGGGWW